MCVGDQVGGQLLDTSTQPPVNQRNQMSLRTATDAGLEGLAGLRLARYISDRYLHSCVVGIWKISGLAAAVPTWARSQG